MPVNISKLPTTIYQLTTTNYQLVAGRKGAAARWAGVERKPTEKIRVYCEDADRLRAMPGTMGEALHAALRRLKG